MVFLIQIFLCPWVRQLQFAYIFSFCLTKVLQNSLLCLGGQQNQSQLTFSVGLEANPDAIYTLNKIKYDGNMFSMTSSSFI